MIKREIARTRWVRQAVELAGLLTETEASPIGEVVGASGTGKSMAARAIAQELGAVRVACYEGMSRFQLLGAVVAGMGMEGPSTKWMAMLAEHTAQRLDRPLLVVDEANKLLWRALEALRWLADEAGYAVLLVGTELYERQFTRASTRPLLLQLGRRIGAKRCRMEPLDRAETWEHVLRPRFGELDRETATRFWTGCRKGNWGEAVELAEECGRLMRLNGTATLTPAVLEAALAWSANRREVA